MDVTKAIDERRAYRSLDQVKATESLARDLAEHARLAPSCYNHQPWRFVFVFDPEWLTRLQAALSQGNAWAKSGSMIIAVFSRQDLDCELKGRDYYLFDTGMATAFLILRATELGLVAHPIAGYDEEQAKGVLGIPEDMKVITLVVVGKHSESLSPVLSDDQKRAEVRRPGRLPIDEFAHMNCYVAN